MSMTNGTAAAWGEAVDGQGRRHQTLTTVDFSGSVEVGPAKVESVGLAAPAKPVTVSDVDELRVQVTALRDRVWSLFTDDRLTHTQSAAAAATVDAFNSVLSAALVLKAVTS